MEIIEWQKDDSIVASAVYKEIEAWKTAQEFSSFKAEIEEWGGLEEFVAGHPKSFSWVESTGHTQAKICKAELRSEKSKKEKACWEVIADVLDYCDGSILLAKLLREVKSWDPAKYETHQAEIQAAGGIKKYIAWYPDHFDCELASGPGTETVTLKSNQQPCVDTIAELLEWHEGVLLSSRLLPEMQSWRPKALAGCKKEIEAAGGIKKFISQYPSRFEWTLADGPGTEAIKLIEEKVEVQEEDLLKVMANLVKWHGGSIIASRIFIDLKAWRPDDYESLRSAIKKLGGLKTFASKHPDRFKWKSDTDEGKDSICLVEELDLGPLVDMLVELLTWHNGFLLASQVFKSLKTWDQEKTEQLRKEIGPGTKGLKKLVQKFPDRLEWVAHSDQGKEAVRLVKAKVPAAELTPASSDWAAKYQ
jgi:hypothetical protein